MPEDTLTPSYEKLFGELSNHDKYVTYSVASFYCDHHAQPDPSKINVVIRMDVDNGLHLCPILARRLKTLNLNASFYFLTRPHAYYSIWGSGIPKIIADLGFEVGLHSDHLYEAITENIDGQAKLKEDIRKLSQESGTKVRGMVYHGHPGINTLNKKNWDLYKFSLPEDFNLDYHDGYKSCYLKPGSLNWTPNADCTITDFLGFSQSWGWNYYPSYPLERLKKAHQGQVVHIAIHPLNAFKYWTGWEHAYGEKPKPKESAVSFVYKSFCIRTRHTLLKGKSFPQFLFGATIGSLSIVLAKGVGFFWPRPKEFEFDKSYEASLNRIFSKGIPYWESLLKELGMDLEEGEVLEVGSGNGQWLLAYARNHRVKATGLEPSEKLLDVSLRKADELGPLKGQIQVIKGFAENIPFENNAFDRVLCAGVFMFTEQEQAFKEMLRVLKKEGKICILANGLGYFIMHILNGFRYKSVPKMYYGLKGVIATVFKWYLHMDLPFPKACRIQDMEELCRTYNGRLIEQKALIPMELYPETHGGYVTNYAFLIGHATPSDATRGLLVEANGE